MQLYRVQRLLAASTSNCGTYNLNYPQFVGGKNDAGSLQLVHVFTGEIDEVRVSSVRRSADWIHAEYAQTAMVGTEQANS